jgi:hypothetical protein
MARAEQIIADAYPEDLNVQEEISDGSVMAMLQPLVTGIREIPWRNVKRRKCAAFK